MAIKRTKRQLLTPQELEIMKIVWEAPEVTVRDVYETLRQTRTIAYTSVMTVMQILEKKGHLKKSTDTRQHVYRATRARKHTVSALLGDFVDRVFNGSTKPLLVHLVEDGQLSKADLDELRALVRERK
jgi:BlaI family penicillinase repressor